jgi:hypothetical protein
MKIPAQLSLTGDVGAGLARDRVDRGHEKLLIELLVELLAIWLGCPNTTAKSLVIAIQLSEQKTLTKSLVMFGPRIARRLLSSVKSANWIIYFLGSYLKDKATLAR